MQADTREWLTIRAVRLLNPRPRLPEGYEAVPAGTLEALTASMLEDAYEDASDSGDEPFDPDAMRALNLSNAMALNDTVEPVVEHIGALLNLFRSKGFSEDAAEHMCMTVWGSVIQTLTSDE